MDAAPAPPAPVWPPEAEPGLSDALKPEVPISPELDCWTSPELTVSAVKDVICCGQVLVLLLEGCSGPLQRSNLALWRPPPAAEAGSGSQTGVARLRPLLLRGAPVAPEAKACGRLWPGDGAGCFAQCGSGVWRLEIAAAAAAAEGKDEAGEPEPVDVLATQVLALPERVGSMSCCSLSADRGGGLFCAMLVSPQEQAATAGPLIVAAGSSLQQRPAAQLCVFEPRFGLRAVADAPRLSEQLVLSAGGIRQVCVWRTMLNEIPEEAERGEFLAFDCSLGDAEGGRGRLARKDALCLTRGAGRVGSAAVSDDGELILLQANYSMDRPVTTHMALLLLTWPRGEAGPRPERRMLIEGQHIQGFDFLPPLEADGPRGFYVTRLAGVDPETELWSASAQGGARSGPRVCPAVLSRSVALTGLGAQRDLVFGTERGESLPELALARLGAEGDKAEAEVLLSLPQPDGTSSLFVEKIVYPHGDAQVTALLFERREPACSPEAPLLVHVHGGPAIGVVRTRRTAADQCRYPYKHLLMAGYRVLQPLFRGTLGFGDNWSQGNIGSQGSVQGDLGDILAGLDWLNSSHPRLRGTVAPSRTGIWGGSYGGYMTIRAMASVGVRDRSQRSLLAAPVLQPARAQARAAGALPLRPAVAASAPLRSARGCRPRTSGRCHGQWRPPTPSTGSTASVSRCY
uniref:Peptidase S9 prolyl oligopeptidase catalytic domain-containing protein n=1 Tax=Alexandrium monilatum TaxID=311494 RepID=A0A7S4Q890_9DINO